MPQMGVMAGYAVTLIIEPSDAKHKRNLANAWQEYRRYVASASGPKIVVVQDLDKPDIFGSFWGEVNANIHRALGCVGTIVDGAIRDLDEMNNAGFKALARRLKLPVAYDFRAADVVAGGEGAPLGDADFDGFAHGRPLTVPVRLKSIGRRGEVGNRQSRHQKIRPLVGKTPDRNRGHWCGSGE